LAIVFSFWYGSLPINPITPIGSTGSTGTTQTLTSTTNIFVGPTGPSVPVTIIRTSSSVGPTGPIGNQNIGGPCQLASDCLSGLECVGNICQSGPTGSHGDPCLVDQNCASEFVCSNGVCDYSSLNLNSCPRGVCSTGHSCQSGQCQPNLGMICNSSSVCTSGSCQTQPAIYHWKGTFGREFSTLNPVRIPSETIDGWEKLTDLPPGEYDSLFANLTNSEDLINNLTNQPLFEFWIRGKSGDLYHYNPVTHRWNIAISSLTKSAWKSGKDIVRIDRVMALAMANFGIVKGRVVVALSVIDRPYSIFAEVLPDPSSLTGYTLVSRTTYPGEKGNGQIFYQNQMNQKLVPLQAIKISFHGDNRLTILGQGTDMNLVRIFTPTSTDQNGVYQVETESVTEESLLDSYSSDRTQPSISLNTISTEFSNILHTNINQRNVTYNGQQMMAPDLPVNPPPGAREWSISSLSTWSNNPPMNIANPTFPILIQNQDQVNLSNIPRAWLYNVINTSTGFQLQVQGNYPEQAMVATADNQIFLYSPSQCL
jgi:hypothetical protein